MTRLIKTTEEIDLIREGGRLLGHILAELARAARPGTTSLELEEMAVSMIEDCGGRPAFKGYRPSKKSRPFPTALCVSVNDEIVHGPATPSRAFKEGDIVSIDIGMEYPYVRGEKGYYTDTATTVGIGSISKEAQRLLDGTRASLEAGLAIIKPGVTLLELGTAIEKVLKGRKLGIIRDLVGHGVGLDVHEEPQVPNYAFRKGEFADLALEPGMVIAVEPMATLDGDGIRGAGDGFTYSTADGSLSAHFEHTILITEDGCEIMTEAR